MLYLYFRKCNTITKGNRKMQKQCKIMNVQEVAKFLGVGYDKALQLLHYEIPSFNLGRKIVTTEEAVLEWIEEQLKKDKKRKRSFRQAYPFFFKDKDVE